MRGRGSVAGCAECAAVTEGTVPSVGVGLLTTLEGVCCAGGCVATEQVELERAGLAGGTGPVGAVDAGFVLIGDGTWVEAGKDTTFGEEVFAFAAVWLTEVGPACGWPNSPGAKERVEQNPSEELMSNVNPSTDL